MHKLTFLQADSSL